MEINPWTTASWVVMSTCTHRGGEGLGDPILAPDQRKIHHVTRIALQIAYPAGNVGIQLRREGLASIGRGTLFCAVWLDSFILTAMLPDPDKSELRLSRK